MDPKMFCFQCEQTAKGQACTGIKGVCGKTWEEADLQDELTGALIAMAVVVEQGAKPTELSNGLMIDGMFTCLTNVEFDEGPTRDIIAAVRVEVAELAQSIGVEIPPDYPLAAIWDAPVDVRTLKTLIVLGLRGTAAYAYHAHHLGFDSPEVYNAFYKGLALVAASDDPEVLLPMVLEVGKANYECMALLDKANTETYGEPTPTVVDMVIEPGPFIVISGHDLHDMKLLLDQCEGTGVSVYTHGEMLPGQAYPELAKYECLKGNFGTAWQNQQREFDGVPGAFLFTTNCLMPPRDSYADRVFTTGVVGYPGLTHIGPDKDFTPVIEKAKELGGYQEPMKMHGINGGGAVTTGCGRAAVLSVAPAVIEAVQLGAVKHFFLVGGCDGARPGRNYYTEFVEKAPADSVILTLACGKYRFNDLDLGEIGGIPRLLDVGQCNDAYGAIQIALALADAFDCGVNDLPLGIVLSWYEQKAVAILLTLLYLGIKDIYLGPTLPAFVSPDILQFLVDTFQLHPTTTVEADMAALLGE